MKKIFLTIFIFLLVLNVYTVSAQTVTETATQSSNLQLGIATNVPLNETGQDGDIVSYSADNGYSLSSTEYDSNIYGVISLLPALQINISYANNKLTYPIIKSGTVEVNVSLTNGPIKKGDAITTSKIKGVGMKADKTGYVLGTALEDYGTTKSNEQKQIMVSIDIHSFIVDAPAKASLWDIFSISTAAASQQPFQVFKYLIAAIVAILSVVIGFLSFGRLARAGVEALGRNPLASRKIQLGIIFNTIISIVIICGGLFLAILILKI